MVLFFNTVLHINKFGYSQAIWIASLDRQLSKLQQMARWPVNARPQAKSAKCKLQKANTTSKSKHFWTKASTTRPKTQVCRMQTSESKHSPWQAQRAYSIITTAQPTATRWLTGTPDCMRTMKCLLFCTGDCVDVLQCQLHPLVMACIEPLQACCLLSPCCCDLPGQPHICDRWADRITCRFRARSRTADATCYPRWFQPGYEPDADCCRECQHCDHDHHDAFCCILHITVCSSTNDVLLNKFIMFIKKKRNHVFY